MQAGPLLKLHKWNRGKGATLNLSDVPVVIDKASLWNAAFDETLQLTATHVPRSALARFNPAELQTRYAPQLHRASTSRDVDALLKEILSHLRMSHAFVTRPARNSGPRQGMAGVDTGFDNGWLVTSVPFFDPYSGVSAGLADPATGTTRGDRILTVDGRKLTASVSPARQLAGKAGRTVRCTLESSAGVCREVAFEAPASERPLRYEAWTQRRERQVMRFTRGQSGYLHIPETSQATLVAIERWLLCHQSFQRLIIDLRYNEGGGSGTELASLLARKPLAQARTRWAGERALPAGTATRRIAALVNRFTSSGGELVAELLRQHANAVIIGERTFGGGVGHTVSRKLASGSHLWLPEMTIHSPAELARIENHGVLPDIIVPWWKEWMRGGDRFILEAIRQLEDAC